MLSKGRKAKWIISIMDAKGGALFCDTIERLCFEEACVISLSKEFFNDPNPCEIHRSAVILRAVEEIRAACAQADFVHVSALSERVQWLLKAYPLAFLVRAREEKA